MSQQSISRCRVCETPYNLCSPFINPPPPCYYLRTIPYSLLNPCLQEWCHKEHHSAALHIPQTLTPNWHLGCSRRLRRACMHTECTSMSRQERALLISLEVVWCLQMFAFSGWTWHSCGNVCSLCRPSARRPVDTSQQRSKKWQRRTVLRMSVLAVWWQHLWEG